MTVTAAERFILLREEIDALEHRVRLVDRERTELIQQLVAKKLKLRDLAGSTTREVVK
jgi:hypothetical protein